MTSKNRVNTLSYFKSNICECLHKPEKYTKLGIKQLGRRKIMKSDKGLASNRSLRAAAAGCCSSDPLAGVACVGRQDQAVVGPAANAFATRPPPRRGALALAFLRAGCRVCEVLNLRREDLRLDSPSSSATSEGSAETRTASGTVHVPDLSAFAPSHEREHRDKHCYSTLTRSTALEARARVTGAGTAVGSSQRSIACVAAHLRRSMSIGSSVHQHMRYWICCAARLLRRRHTWTCGTCMQAICQILILKLEAPRHCLNGRP